MVLLRAETPIHTKPEACFNKRLDVLGFADEGGNTTRGWRLTVVNADFVLWEPGGEPVVDELRHTVDLLDHRLLVLRGEVA